MEGQEKLVRVSIIMGIYNCAATLPEAIDSLLAQTSQGWKLIMCDDASIDDTYAIAESYQMRYPEKIILIRNEKNKGLNYTLNHCLQYVDTEFVARMDGDDLSLSTRFEKEMDFLDKNPQYSIVSTSMIYFDENGVFRTGTGGGEPNRRRNVGVDGRKNFTVRKPDRISGLTAHGIAAEIYTVTVDAKLANSPFDRIENALFA